MGVGCGRDGCVSTHPSPAQLQPHGVKSVAMGVWDRQEAEHAAPLPSVAARRSVVVAVLPILCCGGGDAWWGVSVRRVCPWARVRARGNREAIPSPPSLPLPSPIYTIATTNTSPRRGSRGSAPRPLPRLDKRPQVRQEYPLNLSISLSGGKETNKDSPSSGE